MLKHNELKNSGYDFTCPLRFKEKYLNPLKKQVCLEHATERVRVDFKLDKKVEQVVYIFTRISCK